MTHKYANVLVHVVFSTKERRNLVPAELQRKLWKYIEGIGVAVGRVAHPNASREQSR